MSKKELNDLLIFLIIGNENSNLDGTDHMLSVII